MYAILIGRSEASRLGVTLMSIGFVPGFAPGLCASIARQSSEEFLNDPWAMLGMSQPKKDLPPGAEPDADQDPMAVAMSGKKAT